MQVSIPAVFMRGGTSRAVCFREDVLAAYPADVRERIILAALGSPDADGRQIDGLGGGISSLSKVVIVGPARGTDHDVTFTFGQVDVRTPLIDWSGTCGNMSAAVSPFAIDEGMVPAVEPVTRVRVLATNTGKRYVAHVPVCGGRAAVEGDYRLDGVPAPGACIRLEYLDPGGSLGGAVLPTGTPREACALADGREFTVSVVDAAIPAVFVRAGDAGWDVRRLAPELDADGTLQKTLEEIRCRAAVRLGLASNPHDAHERTQHTPKVVLVAPPAGYTASSGRPVEADDIDVVVRAVSMRTTHRTVPGTVAMCLAVAAQIEDTVVHDVARPRDPRSTRLGHPAGVMSICATVSHRNGEWIAERVTAQRTARRIMEGAVLVPRAYVDGTAWFQTDRWCPGPRIPSPQPSPRGRGDG